MFFQSKDFRVLEAGVQLAWLQQQLHTQNLANIETPGYKSKSLVFERTLRQAQENADQRPEDVYKRQSFISVLSETNTLPQKRCTSPPSNSRTISIGVPIGYSGTKSLSKRMALSEANAEARPCARTSPEAVLSSALNWCRAGLVSMVVSSSIGTNALMRRPLLYHIATKIGIGRCWAVTVDETLLGLLARKKECFLQVEAITEEMAVVGVEEPVSYTHLSCCPPSKT